MRASRSSDQREGLLGALRAEPSLTLAAAAARFGVPITTAWRWMHAAGIERPPRGCTVKRPTLAEREGPRLRDAWPRVLRGELRIDALADELDVTPNTVYVAARRLGLPSPRAAARRMIEACTAPPSSASAPFASAAPPSTA